MPQPSQIMALAVPEPESLEPDLKAYFAKCEEKLGLVPYVLRAYSFHPEKFRTFAAMYNELMLGASGLSKLEREMIAVVVSSVNRCFYCLTAHGQAVRQLSGDPQLGEMLVMNYRVADLEPRRRALLDYAWKLTEEPGKVEASDRRKLEAAGLSEAEIFDANAVIGFFNMSNRMASGVEMMPNPEYHGMSR